MLKKILFGIAFIAIAAIAAINIEISSKKNFLVDLKNANKEALASTEGGLDFGTICDNSVQYGPFYDAFYGITCEKCEMNLYRPTNILLFCVY